MTYEIKYVRWENDKQSGYAIFKIGVGYLCSLDNEEAEMFDSFMFLGWYDDY